MMMTKRRPVPRQLSTIEDIDPFTHEIHLTWLDKIQVMVMSVTVAPVRLLMIIFLMLFTYIVAAITVKSIPESDRGKPMTGWRKLMKTPAAWLARATFFFFGFHWIKERGQCAPKSKAPIVCCAPHTSFSDIIVAFVLKAGMPSGVARFETSLTPVAGMLTRLTEPVYVKRDDTNSRQNTIKEIDNRARGNWPQVLIYPEGTCGNATCLLSFKQGGFVSGLPVQPACLRYTNRLNTYAWTWSGPSAYMLMWLTLCQFHNGVEVVYLPVYEPSEEEKADSKLYAKNVQTVMARALNIPATDLTLEECKLKVQAEQFYSPIASGLVQFRVLQRKLGYNIDQMKESISRLSSSFVNSRSITIEEFATKLKLPLTDVLEQVFQLFDRNKSSVIDLLDYILALSIVCYPGRPDTTLQLVFKLMSRDDSGGITVEDLSPVLSEVFGLQQEVLDKVWAELDKTLTRIMTFDEFKGHVEVLPVFAELFKNCDKGCERETNDNKKES